jgi:hypothetical protein
MECYIEFRIVGIIYLELHCYGGGITVSFAKPCKTEGNDQNCNFI